MMDSLAPVEKFHDADELERQLKAHTLDLFREYLRVHERSLNTFGAPHLGDFAQIERWVKMDGLSMVRGNSQDAMRYLFKAWRSRNPKRGLHFLRLYLQLLWPDGWGVAQLWHKKGKTYPDALVSTLDDPGLPLDMRKDHYLTSRVNIDVYAYGESGQGLASVGRALRSTLSAKFVVAVRLLRAIRTDFELSCTGQASAIAQAAGGIDAWVDSPDSVVGFFGHGQAARLTHTDVSTDPSITPDPMQISVFGFATNVSVTVTHSTL